MNWLRCSGIWAGVVINPYHWEFDIRLHTDANEYGMFFFEIKLGIAWLRVVIDDGRW